MRCKTVIEVPVNGRFMCNCVDAPTYDVTPGWVPVGDTTHECEVHLFRALAELVRALGATALEKE